METIILKIDNKTNAKKLFEALHLLKGVKDVSIVHDSIKGSDIMDEIELSLKQVKKIQQGKLPRKSLKNIIGG